MKGGIAAMCGAAISLLENQESLNGTVRLTFVADEEQANLGMHHFLDTLNLAFAKLFDNLYQDTSMDITADISVLHTLLAQEGLTREEIRDAMKGIK